MIKSPLVAESSSLEANKGAPESKIKKRPGGRIFFYMPPPGSNQEIPVQGKIVG